MRVSLDSPALASPALSPDDLNSTCDRKSRSVDHELLCAFTHIDRLLDLQSLSRFDILLQSS